MSARKRGASPAGKVDTWQIRGGTAAWARHCGTVKPAGKVVRLTGNTG